ncbi:MAG: hypothetical protein A07HR60_01211 [uncultured archaeon A07HR60]|nr:MAG: hypothetical protein A07HR60_01211 [uncultured archaeon A07HR60]
MATRTVELEGHIIDSGLIQQCFTRIMELAVYRR